MDTERGLQPDVQPVSSPKQGLVLTFKKWLIGILSDSTTPNQNLRNEPPRKTRELMPKQS